MQARANDHAGLRGAPVAAGQAVPRALGRRATDEQNLVFGCMAGIAAAAVGAALWAAVTYFTEYQIGWMAVGVGLLVGFAVRQFGKGTDTIFGILGGALALAGCLAGNLLTICLVLAREEAVSLFEVFSRLDPGVVLRVMTATFGPIDLLFYGLAVYEGYKFSFRPVAEEKPAAATA